MWPAGLSRLTLLCEYATHQSNRGQRERANRAEYYFLGSLSGASKSTTRHQTGLDGGGIVEAVGYHTGFGAVLYAHYSSSYNRTHRCFNRQKAEAHAVTSHHGFSKKNIYI